MHFYGKIKRSLNYTVIVMAFCFFCSCNMSIAAKDNSNTGVKPGIKTVPSKQTQVVTAQEEANLPEENEDITINDDDMFLKLGDSQIKLHLRRVPKGSFNMGISEEQYKDLLRKYDALAITKDDEIIDDTARKVSIEQDYFIGKYEVSKEQYAQFDPSYDYPEKEKNIPMTNISVEQANEFCAWLNKQYENYEIRLPKEIEWEYAAKGATENTYTWGMDYDKSKANLESEQLLAVGSKPESDSWVGASDMLGNATEMCSIDEVYQRNDEYASVSARGGRYFSDDLNATTTTRHLLYSGQRVDVGFRIVAIPLEPESNDE